MRMVRLLFLTFIFTGLSGFSQVGMNQWRIHFSAFNPVGMAQAGTDVYMACENGIVNFDNEDQSINYLTVTNGLSDLLRMTESIRAIMLYAPSDAEQFRRPHGESAPFGS